METGTVTPPSVNGYEHGKSQQFDTITTPQKQAERGRAVLDSMGFLPIKSLTPTVERGSSEVDTPATDYLKLIDTSETSAPTRERSGKKERRLSKIRRALGMAVTRANMFALSIYGAPAKFSNWENEWRNREELQSQEDDSAITRMQKAVGRNAIRGLVYGGSAAAYVGTIVANIHGHETPRLVDNAKVQTLEVQELASVTAWYGGRTDGQAAQYMQFAKDTGTYNYGSENRVMDYSAQMAPLDGQTMKDSIKPAVNEGVQLYYEAKAQGRTVEYRGFSEGGLPALETVQVLADRGEDLSNVKLYVDGSTVGPGGIYNHGAPQAVEPILTNMMGMKTDIDIPEGVGEVVIRGHSGDPIAQGGDESSGSLLAKALLSSSTHRPIAENGRVISEIVDGNIRYQEIENPQGVVSPFSVALVDAGHVVTPAADRFLDSLLPTTHLGEETQYANAYEVKDATKGLITDTLRINNGIEAGHIVDPIVDSVFNDERAADAQALLNLGNRTPDKVVEMVNNPATIPQNMESIGRDLDAGMQTVGKYLNPGTWMEMLNDGLRGAGVPVPEYVAPPPAPAPVYAPAPEQPFIPPAPAAAPPPAPVGNPVAEFQNNLNQFAQNWQNALSNFGK